MAKQKPTPDQEVTQPDLQEVVNTRDFPVDVTYRDAEGNEVNTILGAGVAVFVSEDEAKSVEKQIGEAEEPQTEEVGNPHDFPVDVTFEDADGQDLTMTLDPGEEIDVPRDQVKRVEKQIKSAEEPKEDLAETAEQVAEREKAEAKEDRLRAAEPEYSDDFEFFESIIPGLSIPYGEPEPEQMQDHEQFVPYEFWDEQKGEHYRLGYLATEQEDVQEILSEDMNVKKISQDEFLEATRNHKRVG